MLVELCESDPPIPISELTSRKIIQAISPAPFTV